VEIINATVTFSLVRAETGIPRGATMCSWSEFLKFVRKRRWPAGMRLRVCFYGYKRRACIDPLPLTYQGNTGLSAENFVSLAKSVGLHTVPQVNMNYNWPFLAHLVRSYRPVCAAGLWNGVPHIILITGVVANGSVYFNDPADGLSHVGDMA
jgi:hypothetical protein